MRPRRYKFNGMAVLMLMRHQGLSQGEMCRRTGLTDTTMRKITRGQVRDPRLSSMTAVANALGVPVQSLIYEVPEEVIQYVLSKHKRKPPHRAA